MSDHKVVMILFLGRGLSILYIRSIVAINENTKRRRNSWRFKYYLWSWSIQVTARPMVMLLILEPG